MARRTSRSRSPSCSAIPSIQSRELLDRRQLALQIQLLGQRANRRRPVPGKSWFRRRRAAGELIAALDVIAEQRNERRAGVPDWRSGLFAAGGHVDEQGRSRLRARNQCTGGGSQPPKELRLARVLEPHRRKVGRAQNMGGASRYHRQQRAVQVGGQKGARGLPEKRGM